MEIIAKPELEKGKEYEVELYPKIERVKATYVGGRLSKQVFKETKGSAVWYIFLDNNWIKEINGIITYKSISSFSVARVGKGQLEEISKLIDILNELGELKNGKN